MKNTIVFGVAAGLLILAMRLVEYRFLVVEHSVEIYGAVVASAFAAAGIWLGRKLTRARTVHVEVPVAIPAGPFVPNASKITELGLTPRELESAAARR